MFHSQLTRGLLSRKWRWWCLVWFSQIISITGYWEEAAASGRHRHRPDPARRSARVKHATSGRRYTHFSAWQSQSAVKYPRTWLIWKHGSISCRPAFPGVYSATGVQSSLSHSILIALPPGWHQKPVSLGCCTTSLAEFFHDIVGTVLHVLASIRILLSWWQLVAVFHNLGFAR